MAASTSFIVDSARLRYRVAEVGFLILLPAVCMYLTPNPLTVVGSIDPLVATGYMLNLSSLAQRFGINYHVTRMAQIIPGEGIYHLFGLPAGFFVLHYIEMLVGCVSLFFLAKRFYDTWVALFCVTLMCLSPWYVASATWDYNDGFAINYLLAGFAFMLVPRASPSVWCVCAGFFFALATNSNFYALAIWTGFLPSLIIIKGLPRWRRLLAIVSAFALGFVFAYALMAYALHGVLPQAGPFFELTAVRITLFLLRGGSLPWYQPLDKFVLSGNYYVLTPAIIALGGAVYVIRATKDRFSYQARMTAAFLLYLIVIIAIYLVNEYVFHGPRATRSYYFSYALIPSYFMLMSLVGQLAARAPNARQILLGAVAVTFLLWEGYHAHIYQYVPYAVFVLLAVAFVLGLAMAERYRNVGLACVLAFAIATPALFFRTTMDYAALEDGSKKAYGLDLYTGAAYLVAVVEKTIPPSAGTAGFWYTDGPAIDRAMLDSLQSVYLWGFSRLPGHPPVVNDKLRSQLAVTKNVVVLGLSLHEVDDALQSLNEAGFDTRTLAESVYGGHVWRYAYAIVRIQ